MRTLSILLLRLRLLWANHRHDRAWTDYLNEVGSYADVVVLASRVRALEDRLKMARWKALT